MLRRVTCTTPGVDANGGPGPTPPTIPAFSVTATGLLSPEPTYARQMRLILTAVLLLGLGFGLSACSVGQESPATDPTRQPTASPSEPDSAPDSGAPDSGAPAQPDASDTKACVEVRAGIDAFNARDYQGTAGRFRLAVPLAQAQARTDPSRAADDLLEAVTYYAELAPKDYPQSAASSPEFAKYKAITLGQCMPVGGPSDNGSSRPPEVDA